MQRFGATPEAWDHFADTLGLAADLLPVVSNPHAVVSDRSTMQALGKTPSLYNREGKVVGFPKWTQFQANEHVLARWKAQSDYGICLQTRATRAFDIDVPDRAKADAIAKAILDYTGLPLPRRGRKDSGKILLPFTYHRALTKHVIPVEGGMIELLADGQQFVAQGLHPDGEPYSWGAELPKLFPVLTGEQLEGVLGMLVAMYSTGEMRIARQRRKGSASDIPIHDETVDWLLENWETYDVGRDGQIFIECPFAGEHTTDSGPSATAYFPAGTGGFSRGHFVCLHAHCNGREDRDFLDATGFNLAQFADLGAIDGGTAPGTPAGADGLDRRADVPGDSENPWNPESLPWPAMVRDKQSRIEPTAENAFNAIASGIMIYRRVAYDAFTDNLMICSIYDPPGSEQWRRFTDADMVDVRIELERRGFKPMGVEMVRACVHAAAHRLAIDSAVNWLSTLEWDGVKRIERFAVECWGWRDTPYAHAVGNYLWTGMAGRVLQPGVRADMAPILIGLQGIKKTTAIQLMVPNEEMYAEIKLDEKDDDLSRKLRGKLIGELEELRGLNSRALEEIKAFVTRRRESWVPKFKEFESFFYRRCLLVGSTNETDFLADPTGERRWLPGFCEFVDVKKIVAWRDQLWAEGAAMFLLEGVMWEKAEELAKIEHPTFKVNDAWERAIAMWLNTETLTGDKPMDKGHVSAGEIMSGALGISVSQQSRVHEARVGRAIKHLGFRETTVTDDDHTYKVFTK